MHVGATLQLSYRHVLSPALRKQHCLLSRVWHTWGESKWVQWTSQLTPSWCTCVLYLYLGTYVKGVSKGLGSAAPIKTSESCERSSDQNISAQTSAFPMVGVEVGCQLHLWLHRQKGRCLSTVPRHMGKLPLPPRKTCTLENITKGRISKASTGLWKSH